MMAKSGYIVLEGGAEFGGRMAEADTRAIELAGGPGVPVSIIPTAAAPDHNDRRAGTNGTRWFRSLGATHVETLPLVDKSSANDAPIIEKLSASRLIYMLGGFPGYLGETLRGSRAWEAMVGAYQRGAVLAGSSAGAMVLCQYFFDPRQGKITEGLGLLPNTCVLPHHNTFGKGWVSRLSASLPDVVLLGLDERTAIIDDATHERQTGWRVYGQGTVTVYRRGQASVYQSGENVQDTFMP